MESYKHFGMRRADSRLATQFERIGTNYKLSNIQAAIGLVQMQHIDTLLAQRKRLARRYFKLLNHKPEVSIPKVTPKGVHSRQSYCIFTPRRNKIIEKLKKKNIETQIGTYALHMLKAFYDNPNCRVTGDMTASRYAFDHCLTLPLYHDMTEYEQKYVVEQLLNLLS
jgi:dTDP-4-amino-4,6-dideoxygalactose transaminase